MTDGLPQSGAARRDSIECREREEFLASCFICREDPEGTKKCEGCGELFCDLHFVKLDDVVFCMNCAKWEMDAEDRIAGMGVA